MAIITQYTYTSTGTEEDFMTGLVNLICSLDSGITCEDANGDLLTMAQFYSDTSNQIFYLNFNGNKLTVQRNFIISQAAQSFKFSSAAGTNASTFSNGNLAYNNTGTRAFYVSIIKTDNICMFSLGSYNISSIASVDTTIFFVKKSGITYTALLRYKDFTGSNFIGTNSSTIYIAKLLPFISASGELDYISKTPFCSGSVMGVKVFDCPDIYSVTTTTVGTSLALPNGKNLYTIGSNWAVEVTEEEEQEEIIEGQSDSVPSMQ